MRLGHRLASILAIAAVCGICRTQAQTVAGAASSGRIAVGVREPVPLDRTPLAITNVSVIPMDQDAILAGQNVVIEDGFIVAVGPAASTPVPAGIRRLDGTGLFLMPGLIDAHVHLQYQADSAANPTLLGLHLAHGVTTIVNLLGFPKGADPR